MRLSLLKTAFLKTIPVLTGYVFLGLGFGIPADRCSYHSYGKCPPLILRHLHGGAVPFVTCCWFSWYFKNFVKIMLFFSGNSGII